MTRYEYYWNVENAIQNGWWLMVVYREKVSPRIFGRVCYCLPSLLFFTGKVFGIFRIRTFC